MKKLLVLIFVVFSYTLAFSHMHDSNKMGMGMMGMGMMGYHMEEMVGACLSHASEINLSDEQIKKLQPLHREIQKILAKFRADMKIAELDLMEVMDVKDFDLQKAEEISKKITELRFAEHKELLRIMKEVRSILTEEQFQKMKKMKMMGQMPMKKQEMMKQKRPLPKK